MTRQDITSQAALLLREGLGTPGASDPFTLDNLADKIADEIAMRTDCFFSSFSADLVAGKTSYCSPNLKKILGVFVVDAQGKVNPIRPTTRGDLDQQLGAYWWRNAQAADPPRYAAFEGGNSILLGPPPSVARAGAITMEGYAIPKGLWPNQTDECPLPPWAHDAVVSGVCYLRSLQFIKDIPESVAAWKQQYRSERGMVEATSALHAPRTSVFCPGWWF